MEYVESTIEQKKPDWSIKDLYRTAWQIVKKNKILWLFGMAIGAGGMSGNYSNSIDGKDLDTMLKIFDKSPKESSSVPDVLGSSTSVLSDTISSLFANIPPAYYALLGLEVLFLIILGIVISIIYSSWANAALLEGIQTATANGKLTIKDLSEKAFGSIKSVIYISYVPYLLVMLVLVVLFAIFGILAFALPDASKAFVLLLMPISILLFVFALAILTLVIIWALRIVIIDKKPAKIALRMGYRIAKKKFWASILLGLVNTITIGLLYILVLLPIIGIIIWGAVTISSDANLGTGIIVVGAVLLIIFILGASILGGITNAFKATIWSLAYNAIRGKYEK